VKNIKEKKSFVSSGANQNFDEKKVFFLQKQLILIFPMKILK